MFETINTTSQTVATNGSVNLGTVTINDGARRITLSGSTSIEFNTVGKYKIEGTFIADNSSSSSATSYTLQLYANGVAQGIPVEITVPENGYGELYIQKTINVIPSTYGNSAVITFVSTSGIDITNLIVDVYKRS